MATPLMSMTGFARSDGSLEEAAWHWELRSVNGRGLDIRVRLPAGLDGLEQKARTAIANRFVRGNITANLQMQRGDNVVQVILNEENLAQVLRAADRICTLTDAPKPSADALLSVKGVLEYIECSDDAATRDRRHGAILTDLDVAIDELTRARAAEGAKLAALLSQQVREIGALIDQIACAPTRRAEAIAARLAGQIQTLLATSSELSPERLHQEAVLLAMRSDITEEVARLQAHCTAAGALIENGSPAGRKLDFLTQELHREANTICSKSNDIDISRSGLALKTVIDQMREQVQNIE